VKLSLDGLFNELQTNVLELKFVRRTKNSGKPTERRMLATLDSLLLNSDEGKKILNFKAPTQSPAYNTLSRGLLTVWDILYQDWRNIPVTSVNIIAKVPTRPADEFWKYFNETILKMSASRKAEFMSK
jgi:hypothetical protein